MDEIKQFNFGKNWKNFSEFALSGKKIENARKNFKNLFENITLENKTFLDIGFGQGLSLLIANENGARTFGCDINPLCKEVLDFNKLKFSITNDIPLIVGSIIENSTIDKIQQSNNNQLFDIVHSWGVLHHTGDMWKAIETTQKLVNENGILVLAIYNKHFTSKFWCRIKKIYNSSNRVIRTLLLSFYLPLIFLRYLFILKNPMKLPRGMSLYYDAIDWLGGFPYEYATIDEISNFMKEKGFSTVKIIKTTGFTGCNEFVFKKNKIS